MRKDEHQPTYFISRRTVIPPKNFDTIICLPSEQFSRASFFESICWQRVGTTVHLTNVSTSCVRMNLVTRYENCNPSFTLHLIAQFVEIIYKYIPINLLKNTSQSLDRVTKFKTSYISRPFFISHSSSKEWEENSTLYLSEFSRGKRQKNTRIWNQKKKKKKRRR